MQEKALLGIVLFPLLGAIACALLGRGSPETREADRKTVHWVACLSVAGSFALALYCFAKLYLTHRAEPEANPTLSFTAYEWFSISGARARGAGPGAVRDGRAQRRDDAGRHRHRPADPHLQHRAT